MIDNSAGVSFEAMLLAMAALNLISEVDSEDDWGGRSKAAADVLGGAVPGNSDGEATSEETPIALPPNREKT